jgi:hypothetical protein
VTYSLLGLEIGIRYLGDAAMAETAAKTKGTDRQKDGGGQSRGLMTGNKEDGGDALVLPAEGSLRRRICRVRSGDC